MHTLILASASPYKRALLERLGIPFSAHDPDLDETPLPQEPPPRLALRLAQRKALALAPLYPHAFILGADQTVALGSRLLHKPGSAERAVSQLLHLQGHTHHLHCAVALLAPGSSAPHTALVSFEMAMRPLDEDAIRAYVALDAPLDCAGSYKLEAAGIRLFSSMKGDDYTAIVGLPLTRVQTLLENAGFFAPQPPPHGAPD